MKTQQKAAVLVVSFLFTLAASISAHAASATFSWIANEVTPSGYKIHYGTGSGNYNSVVDAGLPNPVDGRIISSVEGLADGQTYFFAATAYTATEESAYSTEVQYTTPQAIIPDPLVAENLTLQTTEDSPVAGTVVTSGGQEGTISLSVVSVPAHGSVTLQGTEGGFIYTPAANYNGGDSFTFTVSDGSETSAPATASITVVPVNDYPTANGQSFTVLENGTYSGTLTGADIDGDSLTFALSTAASQGAVVISSNGSFTYTPNANVSGSDSFTFRASDGTLQSNTAMVSITITDVNNAPAVGNLAFSVSENASYSGQLSGTDADNDALTFAVASQPGHGSVSVGANGSFTYTPQQDYNGADSFTYRASDGSLQSNTATVSITVNAVNYAPLVSNLAISVDENDSYTGQLSGSDQDNDTLSFTAVSQPANGSVSVSTSGGFTYTPNANYSGSDQFTYKASDGSTDSNTGSVSVIVNAVVHEFAYETGELLVSNEWQQVNFETVFVDPAVVVNATSANSSVPVLVNVRSLSSAGFEIRVSSWPSEEPPDQSEIITFIAMEKGNFEVMDGFHVEAGCTEVSGLNSFTPVALQASMAGVPVVLASVVSSNDADAVTVRVNGISELGFSAALQEQESNDGYHAGETVCYIASQKYSGQLGDNLVEIASAADTVTDQGAAVGFGQKFPSIPFAVAAMQSANGMDPSTLAMSSLDVDSMTVKILEEQSADDEVGHVEEAVGYFAIVPYNPEEDSDNDGLSNADELELGTHPGINDSDNDGISDGDELQYLLDNSLNASTDSDNDGIVNLLDADSDNDGMLDGAEIAQGSDPTVPGEAPGEVPVEESTSDFNYEIGEVLGNHEPVHVQFSRSFTNPVVIANAVTRNGAAPFVVRVSNVSAEGFDVSIQEYDYLDGTHKDEIISYLVVEEGSYTLADGTVVEAGRFEASAQAAHVGFSGEFPVAPVVLTSTTSMNSAEAVAGRVWDVTVGGFEYMLQEQEANARDHGVEAASFIAWTPGAGSVNGLRFEAGTTPDKVTNKSYTIQSTQQFPSLPFHFAGMLTLGGADTSAVKIIETYESGMTVRVEEEQSNDRETNHTTEVAGYLILLQE